MAHELDFSMLGHDDLVNIVLQRSEVLHDLPRPGRVIRAWMNGDAGQLEQIVADRGVRIAADAVAVIETEFQDILPELARLAPRRIADIGCGYGVFSLFAHRALGAAVLLIDIEENSNRHFGFQQEAAAYASLAVARRMLENNGVPAADISTWNPNKVATPPDTGPIDLAVSFLSCGFHYPVATYLPFFRDHVAPEGAVILDIRASQFEEEYNDLATLGDVEILRDRDKHKTVLLRKVAGR